MDYKEANETVGTGTPTFNFGEAMTHLKQGKMLQRIGWNGKGLFIFRQVPSQVSIEIVPKMTSLPDTVKAEFVKRSNAANSVETEAFSSIRYSNQIVIVKPNNEINNWAPSVSDSMSDDWCLYNV